MGETAIAERPLAGAMVEANISREAKEVEGLVFSAKRFPRDLALVRGELMMACSSVPLAESSQYSYSKGGADVSGPSIRLAEALKGAYGNIDAGWVEIERRSGAGNMPGESVIRAFAWDLQKNVRAQRVFTVRHWRDKKGGQGYPIKEEREIYELCANQAARRLRACILELIPKFIIEEAMEKCDETLKKTGGPLEPRIQKTLAAFKNYGVTTEMIEKRIGHKVDAITEAELLALNKIGTSIRDGFQSKEEYFPELATAAAPAVDNMVNAEAPPQSKPQSIKKVVQNHAPQTSEEAKARQATAAQQSAEQPARLADPKSESEKSGLSVARLTQEICQLARDQKWDAASLRSKFDRIVHKQPDKCSAEELDGILTVLKTEVVNANSK